MNTQPELIAGIYNFCDAWCERCLFTSRCRSFQLQQEASLANSQNSGDKLIQQLTEALNLTKQYVENLSRKQDFSDTERPTEIQAQQLEHNAIGFSNNKQHALTNLAKDYLQLSGIWLKEEKNLLEQIGQQQIREVELGLRNQENVMPLLVALKDAWDMIRWYRTLIPVKTQSVVRALQDPVDDTQLQNYYLGKIKLILVSIDRSLLAWQTIIQYVPEKTDGLLDLMALLSRQRREWETFFPDARAFKRPGLD